MSAVDFCFLSVMLISVMILYLVTIETFIGQIFMILKSMQQLASNKTIKTQHLFIYEIEKSILFFD